MSAKRAPAPLTREDGVAVAKVHCAHAELLQGYAMLPPEVLRMIFAHTPQRALLLSVSRVCKRWRAAALRSVRSIRLRAGGRCVPDFNLFPSLTELKLSSNFGEAIELPARIRSLELRDTNKPPFDANTIFREPLPPLTRLSVRQWRDSSVLPGLAFASLNSLTSLHLEEIFPLLWSGLERTHFPQLDTLHFAYVQPATQTHLDCIAAFLRAHSTQLRSLTVDSIELHTDPSFAVDAVPLAALFAALAALEFPRLTHLALLSPATDAAWVPPLLQRAPRLSDLCLPYASGLYSVAPALLAPLAKLRFLSCRDALQPAFLEALPRLRHISYATDEAAFAADFPAPLLSRLLCLTLEGSLQAAAWEALRQCTSLTHLNITAEEGLPEPPPALALPRLTKLKLAVADLSHALPVVRLFMRAAPHLLRVRIDLREELSADAVPETCALLREMQAAGVQKMRLYPAVSSLQTLRALEPLATFSAAHGGWLKVVLVISSDAHVAEIGSAREWRQFLEEESEFSHGPVDQ